jgi:5'-nucleotidase
VRNVVEDLLVSHSTADARPVIRRLAAVAMIVALALAVPAATSAAKPDKPAKTVDLQLLAINDFHGNLEPPTGSGGRVGGTEANGNAGGVEYLATHIRALEATSPHTLEVAAGDLIGASPLLSAAFHDEPTIEAMNALGLDVTSVGNHEFDEGVDELLRMQNGGCHPVDGCQDGDGFAGAAFQFLAANVVYKNSGEPIFPAYVVKTVASAKIGFIGLTLEGTPLIVTQSGIANVNFLDEAATINAATAELKAQGVHTIVVLLHEGGAQSVALSPSSINTCTGMSGAIVDIVGNLDPDVDMVISGHTHNAYNCLLPNSADAPIPVTSAASFGRLVTDIDLTIDRDTDQPTSIAVNNHIVTRDVALDPTETTIVNKYRTAVAPIANRVVGSITADITRTGSPAGESALGDVIADAQLADSVGIGAQLAFMNPGGIRADLVFTEISGGELPGQVTYGEAFKVQPFNNLVATEDLTGAQIQTILNQQWAACTPPGRSGNATVILQVSAGFTYSYDSLLACGSRISNMALNGVPIDLAATYRVTMNNFLADGGDSFPEFKNGTNRVTRGFDVDAFANYLGANAPVAPGPQDRITKIN